MRDKVCVLVFVFLRVHISLSAVLQVCLVVGVGT